VPQPDPQPDTTRNPSSARSRANARVDAKLKLGVLSKLVGVRIRQAQLAIYADFMKDAPVRGLTPGQLAIIVIIDQNPDLTQQRLCDGLGVEKSTMVVRLHRLAERGLIRRVRSADDRRQNFLELTAQGKTKLRAMLAFVIEHEKRMASRLSEAELKQLFTLLAKIR
jgi:DNA-binding MarR family transcriptional regulator